MKPRWPASAATLACTVAAIWAFAVAGASERDLPRCPADVEGHESTCGERVEGMNSGWLDSWTSAHLGIPFSYAKDLTAQGLSGNQSWAQIFCGAGKSHCAGKSGWPGPSTHVVGAHDAVTALGKLLPAKTWSGGWWRGSELALWILSPVVHFQTGASGKPLIDPPAIGLGALPRQHAVMRRMLMRFVNMETWDEAKVSQVTDLLQTSAQQLIDRCKEQGRLAAPDISVWFQQTLHKIVFDVNISAEHAADFDSIGKAYIAASMKSYMMPKFILNQDPFNLKSRQRRAEPYLDTLRKWLKEKHMDLFQDEVCAPSRSCLDQGALGTFDMLQFAGGLSIPSSLMVSLALLYSTSPSNPARQSLTDGFTYAPGEEMQFYWEVLRMFTAVDDVPFWDIRPLCKGLDRQATDALNKPDGYSGACPLGQVDNRTGAPDINAHSGGRRWLLCLALAMRDPAVWGQDADKFRLRPLEMYEKHSVAFLEMSSDATVANGLADRSCPGRKLALLMAQSFLKVFNKHEWATSPNSEIVLQAAVPYTQPFALFPKRVIQECMEKTCKCSDDMGRLRKLTCAWCTSRNCPK